MWFYYLNYLLTTMYKVFKYDREYIPSGPKYLKRSPENCCRNELIE